jgi:DNA-binding NarL/FixJ family response regulator
MESIKRALVLEDNLETQSWLVNCLKDAFSLVGVDVASSLAEAVALIEKNQYEIALVDLRLPDGNGLDFIKVLNALSSPCHIIVATIYDDDKNLLSALKSGAKGYILKDQDKDKIVGYLQGIRLNRPALSPASSKRLIDHFNTRGAELESEVNRARLTPRETDVTCLIAKGYSVDEAAGALELSPDTIRGYVKNIYQKLGVSNRSEITLKALKLGLITTD